MEWRPKHLLEHLNDDWLVEGTLRRILECNRWKCVVRYEIISVDNPCHISKWNGFVEEREALFEKHGLNLSWKRTLAAAGRVELRDVCNCMGEWAKWDDISLFWNSD